MEARFRAQKREAMLALIHSLPSICSFSSRSRGSGRFPLFVVPAATGCRLARRIPARPMSADCSSDTAPGAGGAVEAENCAPDPLVQYVVLRRDLIDSWPLGSIVTQGCHASVAAVWAHMDDPHTREYCSEKNIDHMHKVTLEVKGADQITSLAGKLVANGIAHKLWIEQPENIPTCLATKPYPKSVVSAFFRRLKLCK